MSAGEKFVDGIVTIVDGRVQKAGYDRTIQAQILSCEDATIGKYRCRYQDSIFQAYAGSADLTFSKGAYVYVLVPNNDMSGEKTILGGVKKLGINYISQIQGDQVYDIIGTNCVLSDYTYFLDTNNQDYHYTLYSADSQSDLYLDVEALNQYIKESSSLIIEAVFKTSIPQDRQYKGHFGIAYNLKFQDNATGEEVIRTYILDEDNMIDDPYRLAKETRQYEIFDIDGNNFIRVESIEIFNKDFPNANGNVTTGKLNSGDIEISKIGLSGAVRFSNDKLDGVGISFYTPKGTFFKSDALPDDFLTIVAQVKIKGKLVSAAQDIPFYWGSQNVRVTAGSGYYNKYLGKGWKCLNNRNVISNDGSIVEWVPGTDTFILKCQDATARHNRIKVAIEYDGTIFSEQIDIENKTSEVLDITIQTDNGVKDYFNDIGHPTLICKIDGLENISSNYKYEWGYLSNTGVFESLPETQEENNDYARAVANRDYLKEKIDLGQEFAAANKELLETYENQIKDFDYIQRVEGNRIYDVQIRKITKFGTFKCSVYNENGVFLGSNSIVLTNELKTTDLYTLVINNGSVTFQYNEEGKSPNHKTLQHPQDILGLNFTIYDSTGTAIDKALIQNSNNCKIRWAIPIKNTLLIDEPENGANSGTDADLNYKYYDNLLNFSYNIASMYRANCQNNQIQLKVEYKGVTLTTKTNFNFIKQGDPGTNGTDFFVKIVPNTRMSNPPRFPMITKAGNNYYLNYGLNNVSQESVINVGQNNTYQFFKAQLWKNGEMIWEGFSAADTGLDGSSTPSFVQWTVLRNNYGSDRFDESDFEVSNTLNGYIYYKGDHLLNNFSTPKANIIRCCIGWEDNINDNNDNDNNDDDSNAKKYYGTIPVTTAWVTSSNYRVGLKDNTGFRYVAYTADGVLPAYDTTNPFEFTCKQNINDIWEEISQIPGDYNISYQPSSCGNVVNGVSNSGSTLVYSDSNLLTLQSAQYYRTNLKENQWKYEPIGRYNGQCVNEAVLCIYRQNNRIIGLINIPIHFYLNKFGLDKLNDWDGNSIQINEEGKVILAPQIGAGAKDSNNRFTGVLMGEVKDPLKDNSNIGLLGYSEGDRTFFLNSENGSAVLGKTGNGQLVVDPSQDKALLYSGNFWTHYDDDSGLPTGINAYQYRDDNYETAGNGSGHGMIINLTEPEIYFGSGDFYVNSDGKLHATGAEIEGSIRAKNVILGRGSTIPPQHQGQTFAEFVSSIDAEFGGRNLVLGTATKKTSAASSSELATTEYWYFSDYGESNFKNNINDKLTISFDYKIIGGATGVSEIDPYIYIQLNGTSWGTNVLITQNESGHYVQTNVLSTPQSTYSSKFKVRVWLRYAADGSTFEITNLKVEKGTKPTDWTEAPEDAEAKANQELSNFATIFNNSINNLQAQIDGQFMTYYQDYEPTLNNEPAVTWVNNNTEAEHEGDLFFWRTRGYAYRFMESNDEWIWQLIRDTDITTALSNAARAQSTADDKRRVFITTVQHPHPEPPYDEGDLWMQGENGDIKTCIYSKAEGSSYVPSDWSKLNKYTDDTTANAAYALAQTSISSVDVQYAQNQDPQHPPADESPDWSTNAPQWRAGYYIWQRTATTLASGQTTYSTALCITGVKGDTGKGISSTEIKYGVSDSSSTQPSNENWQNNPPTSISKGKWLWIKTTINYTEGASSVTYNKSYIGTDGKDGKSVYIKSSTKDLATGVTTLILNDGTQDVNILINDGNQGPQGVPGPSGENNYIHVAWANSADGVTDFSTTNGPNDSYNYIGVYTDNTETDSQDSQDYSWALIKGDDGVGISSIVEQYALILDNQQPDENTVWTTTCPQYEEGKSYWTRSFITWDDGDTSTTTPVLAQGLNSANEGVSILSERIDNLPIDGRNLIINTLNPDVSSADKRPKIFGQPVNSAISSSTNLETAVHGVKLTATAAVAPYYQFGSSTISTATMNGLKAGQIYTLSFDNSFKLYSGSPSASTIYYYRIYLYTATASASSFTQYSYYTIYSYFTDDTSNRGAVLNKKAEWTFRIPADTAKCYIIIRPSVTTASCFAKNDYIELSNLQLERGNRATEWAPAYEDFEESMTTLHTYVDTITYGLSEQIDGVVEQWFYSGIPTASNEPAVNWTTNDLKDKHVDDWYYDVKRGQAYRYTKDNDNNTYSWIKTDDSGVQDALANALKAQSTADEKRRVFVVTPPSYPEPPYDIGDLWMQGENGDIKTCVTSQPKTEDGGVYNESHWAKLNKYTSDSAFNTWKNGEYASTVQAIQGQVDAKINTYYQSSNPSTSWNTTALKEAHVGDLWYDSTANVKKYYKWTKGANNTYSWAVLSNSEKPPGMIFDAIDTKRQIFVSQPTPPYEVGDLWTQGSDGEILRCNYTRTSGSYNADDWIPASKSVTALQTYVNTVTANLGRQIDGVTEQWFYSGEPGSNKPPENTWTTTELKDKHVDDWYYDVEAGLPYRYVKTNNVYSWSLVTDDSGIQNALAQASTAKTVADNKMRVFTSNTTPPGQGEPNPDEGDLWFRGPQYPILTYINNQWVDYNYYADENNLISTNLLRWSDFSKCDNTTFSSTTGGNWEDGLFVRSSGGNGTASLVQVDDTPTFVKKAVRITGNTSGNKDLQQRWIPLEPNTDYIFSAYIRVINGTTANVLSRFYDRTNGSIVNSTTTSFTDTNWTRWSVTKNTGNMTNITQMDFSLGVAGDSADIEICSPQLEKGIRVTNWSLSSWDRREEIDELSNWIDGDFKDTIDTVRGQIDGKAESWYQSNDPSTDPNTGGWPTVEQKTAHKGDLWYCTDSTSEFYKKSRMWTGTTWIEADVPQDVYDQIDGKAQIFVGDTTPTNPDEGDLWFKGPDDPILTYVNNNWVEYNQYTSMVENLRIGGTNLLLDTNAPSLNKVSANQNRYFSDGSATSIVPTYVSITDAPVNVSYGVQFAAASATSQNVGRSIAWYSGDVARMVDGQQYTMSAYARVTNGTKMRLCFQYGVNSYLRKHIDITDTSWKQYSWTFTYSASGAGDSNNTGARIYFGVRSYYAGIVQMCGFQLQSGSKATAWSLSQEEYALARETVTSVDVLYAESQDSSTAPTTGWSTNAPTWRSGYYIWQKTVTNFAVGDPSETTARCITGVKGDTGKGISSTTIQYGTSNSASTQPSSWGNSAPTSFTKGTWLWIKTTINYTEGNPTTTYSKSYVGTDGAPAPSLTITGSVKNNGITTISFSDGSSVQVADGAEGPQGTPGVSGYTHIAWATNVTYTGSTLNVTGFATSNTFNSNVVYRYIGFYKDTTETDSQTPSSYKWSLIKGVGISSIVEQYYLSTEDDQQVGGSWSSTCPPYEKGKYYWTRSMITWEDGSSSPTDPVLATTLNEVSNTKIGTTNLILNSNFDQGSANWSNWQGSNVAPTTREIVTIDNKKWLHVVTTSAAYQGLAQRRDKQTGTLDIKPNTEYTLSFTMYAAANYSGSACGIHWAKVTGGPGGTSTNVSQSWCPVALTTTPKRYAFTFTSGAEANTCNVMIGKGNSSTVLEYWITDIKLTEGNVATDWSPAPEDSKKPMGSKNLLLGTWETKTSGATQNPYTGYWYFSNYGQNYFRNNTTDVFTVSFDYTISGGGSGSSGAAPYIYVQINGTMLYPGKYIATNETGHFVQSGTLTSAQASYTDTDFRLRIRLYNAEIGSTVTVSNIQLEKGNQATDWKLADEEYINVLKSIDAGKNMLLDSSAQSLTARAARWARYFSNSSRTDIQPTYIQINDPPRANITYGIRLVSPEATGTDQGRALAWYADDHNVPMIEGQTYTMSAYAKVTNGTQMRILFQYGVSAYKQEHVNISNTTWQQYSWTFTYSARDVGDLDGSGARVYIGARSYYAGTVEMCGFQLEKGPQATDWTPATEDTAYTLAASEDARRAGTDNLLKDTYAFSTNAIYGPANRYFSDSITDNTTLGEFIADVNLPDPNATHFVRISNPTGTRVRGYAFYNGANPPLVSDHYYKVGCWARLGTVTKEQQQALSDPTTLQLRVSGNSANIKNFTVSEGNWKWYEYVTKFNNSGSTSSTYLRTYFYFRPTAANQALDMCGFVLKDVTSEIENYPVAENLLVRTKDLAGWVRTENKNITIEKDAIEDVNVVHFPAQSGTQSLGHNQPGMTIPYALIQNQIITISFWVKTSVQTITQNTTIIFKLTESEAGSVTKYSTNRTPSYVLKTTSDWQKVVFNTKIEDSLFSQGSGSITANTKFFIEFQNTSTQESWIKKPKLELNGYDSQWCKNEYDDIPGGGTNLLKDSFGTKTNSTYNIAIYYFGEQSLRPKEGSPYVLQIKGQLGEGKKGWGVYNSGGTVYEGYYNSGSGGASPAFYDSSTGIYTIIIPSWKITQGSTTATNNRLVLYQVPNSVSATSTIEWVKLEYGTIPTEWTPSFQDLDDKIAVKIGPDGVVSTTDAAKSFKLWDVGINFVSNDYILFEGLVYKCKNPHSSDMTNHPAAQNGSTYWTLDNRSMFTISSTGAFVGSDAALSGTIYSSNGIIGGWVLGDNKLYNNNSTTGGQGTGDSVYLTPRGSTAVINYVEKNNEWVITAGGNFGVTKTGELYASAGYIGNLNIKSDSKYPTWNKDTSYATGNIVVKDNRIYRALKASTNKDPSNSANSSYWSTKDASNNDLTPFYGYIGYRTGMTSTLIEGNQETQGITLGVGNNYFIATDSGARISSGNNSWSPTVYVTNNAAVLRRNETNYVSSNNDTLLLRFGTKLIRFNTTEINLTGNFDGNLNNISNSNWAGLKIKHANTSDPVQIVTANNTYDLVYYLNNLATHMKTLKFQTPASGDPSEVDLVVNKGDASYEYGIKVGNSSVYAYTNSGSNIVDLMNLPTQNQITNLRNAILKLDMYLDWLMYDLKNFHINYADSVAHASQNLGI